jgi:ATP-dependent helicase/nuclease subunit B
MIPGMPWTTERLPDGPSLMRALAQAMVSSTPPAAGILDFSDALVVVPASRAASALERHLNALARGQGCVAVLPRIVTPGSLGDALVVPRGRVLDAVGERRSWSVAMERCESSQALFPGLEDGAVPSVRQLDAACERLGRLHRDCAAAGIGIRDAAEHVRRTLVEADLGAWEAVVAVDASRAALLAECGAVDRASMVRDAARSGDVRAGRIRRVHVLMADPDPVHRMLLGSLASRGVSVTVFVHAMGAELPAGVDDHGFPGHAAWASVPIDVDDRCIAVAEAPADQAAAVMDALAAIPEPRRSDEIAIAAPDPAVAAEVAGRLPSWGVRVRVPPDRFASESSVGLLVSAMGAWLEDRGCAALESLVRHPAVERMLAADDGRMAGAIACVSATVASSGAVSVPREAESAWRNAQGVVDAIDGWLGALVGARGGPAIGQALRAALDRVHCPQSAADQAAGRSARAAIESLESLPARLGDGLAAPEALRLVLDALSAAELPAEGGTDGIEVMGWLEAGIDDAPHMVLTSMNEGVVPEGATADPWLPDSAREALGMSCGRRRRARDAWILHGLLARKRTVRLVAGRVTVDGEPMRPSRLLLGRSGEALAARVLRLADEPGASAARWSAAAPAEGGFAPAIVPEGGAAIQTISVTGFRDWFESPALVRLKRDPRLRLEEPSSAVDELDPMGFGSLVHLALERWGLEEAGRPVPTVDAAAVERDVLAAFDSVRSEAFSRRVRGAYEVQFALACERLRAFALHQARWAADGWKVARVELGFGTGGPSGLEAPLIGDVSLRLTGRIDRVDVHPVHGHAALDYKTSAEAPDPERAHRMRDGRWIDLQLPLYRVLLRSIGIEVAPDQLGYFALPSNPDAAGLCLAHRWDDATVLAAEDEARRIARLIEAGRFDDDGSWRPDPERHAFAPIWCVGMRGLRGGVRP